MSIRINQNSFSRGIISPSLQGRVDLDYYSSGVKKLNNGIVLQEGCIVNRPGLEYIGEAKYSDKKTRLIRTLAIASAFSLFLTTSTNANAFGERIFPLY